ncbi:SusD/RagB family nutrient-binding outer membrane lipoprotein [Chitinophaga barathri]|uniref:SusD/RagB family nutrient-binding outer membrane lipoprotein n=1 Tax=Chitinophaga barathri TaxID=1647451 RepID=A0A3N4MD06_9BACT|nr:SusD/RagB family nutrient-binding outer membrane lipoprotein [Chitinophaga barathri]RPD41448.1 SusD/RagB family nutrient-binding outer membrane lipoprotein [Chitinophaga barathri]
MKRIIYKLSMVAVLISLMATSCTKDFEKTNTDPNGSPTALPEQLLPPALVGVMGYMQIRNRNFNNELMQVTVSQTDAEGSVFRYDFRSNWADYLYNGLYTELTNFKDVYRYAGNDKDSMTYKGISLICQSWIYSVLTDTYGDVPYSQSNLAKEEGIFEPAFDRQKDIYLSIFQKLEEANAALTGTGAVNLVKTYGDPVYNGSALLWRKFGNSLYLRLLLRVAHKTDVGAQAQAKIKEILETKVSTYPLIASVTESAVLKWTGAGPYVSPLMTVRAQDFTAPGVGKFFIDHLVSWNDPRIDIPTWGGGTANRFRIAPYQGAYLGIPSGYAVGENPPKRSYFYATPSLTLMNDPMTGLIFPYAEIRFIKAECIVKGYISSTTGAESDYNAGVQAGIQYWLPSWTTVPVIDYLTAADIQWDDTYTLDQKMEMIHLQKYYALFLVDMQQWFEYRRTGHPVLPKGGGLRNNGVMPARMTYPIYVQSTNPTNYKLAVAAQGPDVISTQVWWQQP